MTDQQPRSRKAVADTQSVVSENPAIEGFTIPSVELVGRAAVRQPGQLCEKFETYSQADAPTFVIATSKQVAAGVDRIAVQPIKETTPTGAKPYRVPEPLSVAADRMIVQDTDMEQPAVELVAKEGAVLTWNQTSVTLPGGDDLPELPGGVCLAREEDGQWIIETTDGSSSKTVTSREELDESYESVNDWVTPTQAGYRNGITLYFTDQWNDLQLRKYEPPTTVASQVSSETLREFLDRTTVESSDSVLEFDRVREEYEAWLGAGTIHRNVFAKHLQGTECETVKQATEAGRQTMIQGRAWRYLSSNRYTARGSPHF